MITVLHVLNTDRFSGAENVVITIIKNMRKKNYRFVYVSYDGMIRDILEENGIEFFPIVSMKRKEIRRVIAETKPDIIHAHDFTASISFSLYAGEIPVISHIHCNPPWIRTICPKTFVYAISCLRYYKILGVSSAIFDEFIFSSTFKKKCVVISNPVNTEEIVAKANTAQDKEAYDIVYLGRLSDEKNPLMFINIIRRLTEKRRDFNAVMIGDGDLRDAVEEKIRQQDLNEIVTMKGYMSNPYGVMRASKIACITSKWEGFGLVACEALALGKPVVCTPAGGLKKIVNDDCGKICVNEEEFANEIEAYFENTEYYEKKCRRAREQAVRLDNLDEYTKQLSSIYNDASKN